MIARNKLKGAAGKGIQEENNRKKNNRKKNNEKKNIERIVSKKFRPGIRAPSCWYCYQLWQ